MTARSGKFVLRVPPELHDRLASLSLKEGQSLNNMCVQLLIAGLDRPKGGSPAASVAAPALALLQKLFGNQLLGIVAFGSRIAGTATDTSDLDLLVVLAKAIPIRRGLYRQWDKVAPPLSEVGFEFDPHFAHIPTPIQKASAVWLEAATSGEVVFDSKGRVLKLLETIRKTISTGAAQRAWSHGHPYWTRGNHEES